MFGYSSDLNCAAVRLCCCAASDAEPIQATQPLWTEEEVLAAFQQHARENMEVIDCVVMESSVCDIVGVVQYHLGDPDVCRFDFMKSEGTPCRMGMEFMIEGEDTLAYAGEDRVSCRMRREDGSVYTATILYYEDAESGEKGFKVMESE